MKLRLVPREESPVAVEPVREPYVLTMRAERERLIATLVPLVRGTVYRMLGPHVSRDDVVQDALIEVARALDRFEGRSSLDTYVRRITARVAYRAISRGRRSFAGEEPDTQIAPGFSPERALEERQALERLHRCLRRLPENRRAAFVLCGIEGMSPQEAAEVAGTSPGSMRARYMHARRELARMLGLKLTEGSDEQA